MSDYNSNRNKITIDPEVLLTISKLSALSVEGVSRMASVPHNLNTLIHHNYSNGVKIEVENDSVYVDLYVVMKKDADLLETSKHIQAAVSRSITEMVGMDVVRVNVHIEDIDYITTD